MNKFLNRKRETESTLVEQTQDERIGYLANELIEELKASGRSIQCNKDDKGFGNLQFWIFNLDNEGAAIEMYCNVDGWKMKIKPTFVEF